MQPPVNSTPNIPSLKERDANLINNWYVGALSSDLKSKPLQTIIYDEAIVLYRDESGKVAALEDRCAHRATQLSHGKICAGKIQCPYHGWTYNNEGRVTHVPSEGEGEPKLRYRVRSYHVVEQDGCIWLWMGRGTPKTATPPLRFPHMSDRGWSHYYMITDFENEVTHLAENFVDVPHTVFVHKGWFRSKADKKVPIKVETNETRVLVTYDQKNDSIGFSGKVLNPSGAPMTHTDCFIMPNISWVDYGFGDRGFLIISQITPVSTLKSRVYTAIIFKMGWLNFLFYPFLRFYTRQVIEQDVVIMANQGASFRRDFRQNFASTDADIVHLAIENLRKRGSLVSVEPLAPSEHEKTIWI
jgi:phenylpropionate dioxygenase-like ring-hydroxylating dioxygenase large terminal subunit